MTPAPKTDPIKRESTSIKIRPDVWKEAKIAAIRQDMELSELVEKALEAWMKKGEKSEGK
jgi:predicted HicB family RNase H-like nuclease